MHIKLESLKGFDFGELAMSFILSKLKTFINLSELDYAMEGIQMKEECNC